MTNGTGTRDEPPQDTRQSVKAGDAVQVDARRAGAVAHLTLQRPALSRAAKRTLVDALGRWGADPETYAFVLDSTTPGTFCAGSDPVERCGMAQHRDEVLALLAEEARLLWRIECCVKPMASLIDGLVTGSGMGLSVYGTHRVAAEGFAFACPQTSRGWFPDGGATYYLGRLPADIGVYLGLTGARLGRADALALGLVTHCIDRRHFDAIRAALADADPIDPLLDGLHQPHGDGEVLEHRAAIARCFGQPTVEAILDALAAETGPTQAWAAFTAAALSRCAPASLKIALRQLRDSAALDLKSVLEMEYRMAVNGLGRCDRRLPATLEAVTPADVAAVFAPLAGGELILPPRPRSLVALG